MDDGVRYTITGTSENDGAFTLTYIDPQKPLANDHEHESTVKEVRKWYNKTTMIQAINNIVPSRSTFVNDLAFASYQQVKEYDVKLRDPLNQIAPTSYKQAGNRESQWFSAEDKERDGIIDFNTWRRLNQATINPEMRKKALRAHHLYDVKREGSAKNRVVANGSRQHPDTYTDTTSPVSSQLMLRLLLVFIAYRQYNTVQMDLTNAYLHAEIKDVVLIIIPDGFPGAGEVALLEKGLYGTKQGSRRFYDHTDQVFKTIGLQPCPSEPCIYRYLDDNGACFVLLYVDDALLTGEQQTVQHIQEELSKHFKCKFNTPQDFLGLDISTTIPGVTSLSMKTFTDKMLLALSVTPWPYPILTPGRTDIKIIRGENIEPNESYRSKVGSLNWLTMGLRMDLVYTTKELSRVLTEPTAEANKILARALQYIDQTKHARLEFRREKMLHYQPPKTRKKPTDIINPYLADDYCSTDGIVDNDDIPTERGYEYKQTPPLILTCLTDIDLGGQLPTRQSTSGHLLYLNGCLFHWRGRTEKLIITATAAGEYIALSRGNQACKHVSAVMRFFGNHTPHYHLYTDNQAAEHIATQPTMSEHSRSIDLRHHSIRQDYIEDNMRIGGVSSKHNTADILTKSLQPDLHTIHTSSLFPDRPLPAPHSPFTNSDSWTSSDTFNTQLVDIITIPTAAHNQYHQLVTHTTHIPHGENPPPLPITRNQTRHDPTLRQARKQWVAYLLQLKPQPSRDMKSPEQHKNKPKRGKKPFHRKDSPTQNLQHTNGRRQVFPKSSNHSPTPFPPRTPSRQATPPSQSQNSQPMFQKGSKTKGERVVPAGKQLQAYSANKPPIKTCPLCTTPCPISHIEANHRHLLADLSDWLKHHRLQTITPTPQTSSTTYRYVARSSRLPTPLEPNQLEHPLKRNHRSNCNYTHRTTPQSKTFHPHHHQQTQMPAISTDTLANACGLGCDVPIRPRNPHTRGTARYTRRQNINRNLRLHLRNDNKTVQNEYMLIHEIQETHYNFYCILSSFDQWQQTRQVLPHDRTLITQWADIYRKGKAAVLRFQQFPDSQRIFQIMRRILVQHVHRTLIIAETGTLVRRPIALSMVQTPLNTARMDHFCAFLHQLLMDPLTTPNFTEPLLDIPGLQTYGDVISDILADAEVQLSMQ
jgi:hypothetical protein